MVEKARKKLVSLIKILAGPFFKNLNLSNYFINKTLNPSEENITFHYYCQECKKEIIHSCVKSAVNHQKKIWKNCNSSNKVSLSNPNYFLSMNFEYQIKLMLQDKNIRTYIYDKVRSPIQSLRKEI